MKVFISYSSDNGKIAGDLFRQLSAHGVESFLAHEAIEVSADWKERILQELSMADSLIVLLSKECRESDWTGHEVGYYYAIAKHNKQIIPISIDGTISFGIFAHVQSKPLLKGVESVPIDLWLKPLVDARPDQLIPAIIEKLEESNVARLSEAYMNILSDHYIGMSSSLLNDLVAAVIKNPNVHNAYACHDTFIPKLVSANRKRLPQSAINRLQERLDGDPTCGKKVILETSLMEE